MGRVLLAGIVGAIVVFVWGAIAWMALGLYNDSVRPMPNDSLVGAALQGAIDETGVYYFPPMPENMADLTEDEQNAAFETWVERHERGPLGMVMYQAEGMAPMAPPTFIKGFVINVLAALLIAAMLRGAGGWAQSYMRRVLFVVLAAAFAVLVTHLVLWNWFYVPTDYTISLVIDVMVGWLLGGLAIAAIVRPKPAR